MPPQAADPPAPPGWLVALGTALVYAVVGWLALLLAGPPGYASPLFPPAGIALAAVLVYGRAAVPGVALGAFSVDLLVSAMREPGGTPAIWLPLVIALGATLQAVAGAWLMRRFVSSPLALIAPRDIVLAGVLGALVACVLSPSVATLALLWAGVLPPSAAMAHWGTWWLGDALGALVGAPAALSLVGRPRADWAPRRLTLALPMVAASGLLTLGLSTLSSWEQQRALGRFERDAERLGHAVQTRLDAPLHALQALHSAARAHGGLDGDSLAAAAAWWLDQPLNLQAMGYSTVVPRQQVAALEAAARAEGVAGFRVFEREDGGLSAQDPVLLVLRAIAPREGNASALGVNTLSIAAAREAVLAARDSGAPAATGGFRLTQSADGETGMVLYQALYAGPAAPADAAQRAALWAGVVFVTLRTERTLSGLPLANSDYLRWCLLDATPGATLALLATERGAAAAGDGSCPLAQGGAGGFVTSQPLRFAGRQLMLTVAADAVPRELGQATWLLSAGGLAATALLGALLLVVTGHSRRTEREVARATEALRQQMHERGQTQRALAEGEARLRAIFNQAPVGLAFLDPQGRYLRVNQRLEQLIGVGHGALLSERLIDRAHPDDRPDILRGHLAMFREGVQVAQQQLRLLRPDGSTVQVRVTASVLRGDDGRVANLVALVEDITESLRLQASERALQQAEASSRAKSEFVSRMSHELRTPLNAMLGFAQLLGFSRDPALAPEQRDWAQQIQRAGWHLLEMINETLDLARIEAGAVQLAQQPVALPPLLADCRAMLADAAAARGIRFEQHLSSAANAVCGDPTRVRQIVINLLSNAVKYNREGGSIALHSRLGDDGMVELAVQDTGLGMDTVQMKGLFEPYNRLGRETSGIEGTGIGLVISRRLAELMGGTLEVASRSGEGSTFTLRLPATALATVADTRAPELAPADYHRRRVHYIEDNATNVEVMRGVLAQRPQVDLVVSTMGLDGLASLRQQRPDLILLDMHLPDISGLELLRHIKHDEGLAGIPVIVVSADATPARMREALNLGSLHYVTKPLDVARFLELLDHVLQQMDTRFG